MIRYFDDVIAVPPGETIKEYLEFKNISKLEFSKKIRLSLNKVHKLLNGELELTYLIASILYKVTRIPIRMWLNLERNYREKLLKISERR